MPFLLLFVLLLHYGDGRRCSNFRRWCMRCNAVFTAADAAITLRRGQMLLNFRRWCRRCVAVFSAVGVAITLRRGQVLLKFSPLV